MIKAIIFDCFGVLYIHDNILHHSRLNNELIDYIASKLKPQYKIGLLSNIDRGAMNRIVSKVEQDKLFDAVALSGETSAAKPSQAAYIYVCNKLGVDAGEVIMIDDSLDNCHGAELSGMYAIKYDDFTELKARLEVMLSKT